MIPEEHEQPNDKGYDMKLVESAERMLRIINRITKELRDADASTPAASVGNIELRQDTNWRFAIQCEGHAEIGDMDLLEVMSIFSEHIKALKIEMRMDRLAKEFDMVCILMPVYNNGTQEIEYMLEFASHEHKPIIYVNEEGRMKLSYTDAHKAIRRIKKLAKSAQEHNAIREAKNSTIH